MDKKYEELTCLQDPFAEGESVYTFENRCIEVDGLRLGDASTKIFINAAGRKTGLPKELADFLSYLEDGEVHGTLDQEIAEKVLQAAAHEEWRMEYMTLLQRDREKYAEGKEEGRAEGIAEGRADLLTAMHASGRTPEEISIFCNIPLVEVKHILGLG